VRLNPSTHLVEEHPDPPEHALRHGQQQPSERPGPDPEVGEAAEVERRVSPRRAAVPTNRPS
jgi:hypothetical protein